MTSTSMAKLIQQVQATDLNCRHAAAIDYRRAWVQLYDGKYVDGILYQRVKLEVMERIPALRRDVRLSTRKICSPDFWESLDSGEKRMAGRCLMHFVVKREVDIALNSRSRTGSLLYCRA